MREESNAEAIRRYSFLKIFADHDSLNADELAFIERLALADRHVDADEREALETIFARAAKLGVTAEVAEEIADFRRRFGLT